MSSDLRDKVRKWISEAENVQAIDFLGRESIHPSPALPVLMQSVFQQLFYPTSPVENFKEFGPIRLQRQDELIPTDGLLGLYLTRTRRIEIYCLSITDVAQRLRSEAEALKCIVRAHEYAHALVHVGASLVGEESRIARVRLPTRWQSFTRRRNSFFSALDVPAHEFLAQLITWVVLDIPELKVRFGGTPPSVPIIVRHLLPFKLM